MTGSDRTQLRVNAIRYEAVGISSFELLEPSEGELPPFTAGAHLDVELPNGLSRSYSLVNPQSERHRYVIAVNHDKNGRGGSRYIHERIRIGELLTIRPPRNNFMLMEDATDTLLIGGGIGITPLWCMVQRLEELNRRWMLYYCARTPEHAAFLKPLRWLEQKCSGRVLFNFDQEPGGVMLDIASILRGSSEDTHVYCCGPAGMLATFEEAAAAHPPDHVHVEYFTPRSADSDTKPMQFSVVLARRAKTLEVPPDKTILQVLLDNGINAPFSCREGICGTCEVRVLDGIPDHRDSILSAQERAANRSMMICCSRSKRERLVIDL